MRQRSKLVISVGSLLETLGGVVGVFGVYRLAGVAWALIAAAILMVALAELVYCDQEDQHGNRMPRVWKIPLPRRPQPKRRVAEVKDRVRMLRARWMIARARRASR